MDQCVSVVMPYPKLEYKYLIPVADADALRARLLPYMEPDRYAGRSPDRQYTVRSVYLDSPRRRSYREKVEGVRYRRKYRIRAYGDALACSTAFLEIKEKRGSYLTKFRSCLDVRDVEALFRDRNTGLHIHRKEGDGIHPDNAEKFFTDYDRKALRPVILVVYEREAYTVNGFGDLRVTMDKNLRAAEVDAHACFCIDGELLPVMQRHYILEVKFTRGVPLWLREELRNYRLRRLALSKYTLSLDAHAR
jgi:hypothetical protein